MNEEYFERYDVFSEEDIEFYKLKRVGTFGDSYIYQNKTHGVLLKELKGYIVPLYEVGFNYKI